jgi:hypothetical protein
VSSVRKLLNATWKLWNMCSLNYFLCVSHRYCVHSYKFFESCEFKYILSITLLRSSRNPFLMTLVKAIKISQWQLFNSLLRTANLNTRVVWIVNDEMCVLFYSSIKYKLGDKNIKREEEAITYYTSMRYIIYYA